MYLFSGDIIEHVVMTPMPRKQAKKILVGTESPGRTLFRRKPGRVA